GDQVAGDAMVLNLLGAVAPQGDVDHVNVRRHFLHSRPARALRGQRAALVDVATPLAPFVVLRCAGADAPAGAADGQARGAGAVVRRERPGEAADGRVAGG